MGNHQEHRFSGDTLRAKAGLLQQQHLENRIHQPDAVPSPNMSVLSASKNPQCSKMHTDTEHYILISPKLMAQQSWIKAYFQAYRTELKQAAFSSRFLQEEQPQTLHPWTITAFSSPVCLLPFKIQSILFKSIPSGPHSWIPWISLKCKSSTCKHTVLHKHSPHLPWFSLQTSPFPSPAICIYVLQQTLGITDFISAQLSLPFDGCCCHCTGTFAAAATVGCVVDWEIAGPTQSIKKWLVKTPQTVAAWCCEMHTDYSIPKAREPLRNTENPPQRR